jgi:hypothetical protein
MTAVAQIRLFRCFVVIALSRPHLRPPGSAAWLDRSGACRGRMAAWSR